MESRHVFVGYIGKRSEVSDHSVLLKLLERHGEVTCLQWKSNKRNALASFLTAEEAASAITHLQGAAVPELNCRSLLIKSTQKAPPDPSLSNSLPQCTSTTQYVFVPGLTLIEDFISTQKEEELLHWFEGQDHVCDPTIKRKVAHYGYVFNYNTREAEHDAVNGTVPDLPAPCQPILARLIETEILAVEPNQLTVNQYQPRQGIAHHVDTHSQFDDGLLSLSLGSGCIMEFRHPDGQRRLQYLPARSLCVMKDEARYLWTHGIAGRSFDMVDGELLRRGVRTSFTFRIVLKRGTQCKCKWSAQCDSQQNEASTQARRPTAIEHERVFSVYNNCPSGIATTPVTSATASAVAMWCQHNVHPHSLVLDVGAGAGAATCASQDGLMRHERQRSKEVGMWLSCDWCANRINGTCESSNAEMIQANILTLPYQDASVDAVLCSLVLHHLSTPEHVLRALCELARVTRVGGSILVIVPHVQDSSR
ncbi:unnamed protein product [Chrysoparadoxa australica]